MQESVVGEDRGETRLEGTRNDRTSLYTNEEVKRGRGAVKRPCPGRSWFSAQGLTITSTTISVTASAGTSLSIRNCRPCNDGRPAASLRV